VPKGYYPSGMFRCADGWLFLACTTEDHWQAMAKAVGRPELAYPGAWPAAAQTGPKGGVADAVQMMLAEDTVDSWLKRFASRAVPCAPIVPLRDVLDSPQVQANGWTVDHEHPKWGTVRQTATLARFSRRRPSPAHCPAPRPARRNPRGSHNEQRIRN
jgi:crotonobetainyl-CoA:carnitine CoA-transferase CaiB-like acyl-CoA transferase